MADFHIGNGYDAHRFAEGRKLMLGSVEIPYERGLAGHSDADVLCHAICDAILGACALGDIGRHFPDTDHRFEGVSGAFLLSECAAKCRSAGFNIANIDAILILQQPKIAPFISSMRERIAAALAISVGAVNIKATTEEKMGFTGRGEGVSAHAVCLVETKKQ